MLMMNLEKVGGIEIAQFSFSSGYFHTPCLILTTLLRFDSVLRG